MYHALRPIVPSLGDPVPCRLLSVTAHSTIAHTRMYVHSVSNGKTGDVLAYGHNGAGSVEPELAWVFLDEEPKCLDFPV